MRKIPPINIPGDENAPPSPSAIDRFFWSRGPKLYGYAGQTWQLAGIILSVAHSIAALLFIILDVTIKGFPSLLPIIFTIAAVISLAGLSWTVIRNRKNAQSEVKVSTNGRKLLYKIGQHIGWNDQYAPHNNRGNPLTGLWQQLFGVKTASNVLTAKSAELLEAGSSEYNRISGLLKLANESNGRSSTLTPQIQAASDEAIVSLINQIALLEDNPETQNAIISQCEIQISKLKELADKFEEVMSGPVTLVERLSSTTVMDNVLDQLTLEAQAHEELRTMDRLDQQS